MNLQFIKTLLGGELPASIGSFLLRVIITLVLTGAYIHYLFEINNAWLNVAWLIIMTVVAALCTHKAARISGMRLLLPLIVGMAVGVIVTGLLFFACAGLFGELANARYIVPVAALLLSTMIAACTEGTGSYYRSLTTERNKYDFLVGNGATHCEAIAPFVRKALESSIRPIAENATIIQLTTMPAMMGMILAGCTPITAMKYQLMLLVASLVATLIALGVTIYVADRLLFDNFGRLRKIKGAAAIMLLAAVLASCNPNGNHKPLIGGDVSETKITSTEKGTAEKEAPEKKQKEKEIASSQISIADLELPKYKANATILRRTGYTTSYDAENKIPQWVAWKLTANHVTGQYKRDGIKFTEDEDVPAPRATHFDYIQSGYDRGHMCPSGDNKWSEKAQQQSFLMTNICPQNHNLNRGDWNEMEQQCRVWAEKYGEVYIVCGPILMNKKHKNIGKNKVTVPEAFFKVVLRMSPEPCAIGFIYRNTDGNRPKDSYVNTVDDVERITKLDFFHNLPDEIEKKIEKTADIQEW